MILNPEKPKVIIGGHSPPILDQLKHARTLLIISIDKARDALAVLENEVRKLEQKGE